jgi:hypothetical protein
VAGGGWGAITVPRLKQRLEHWLAKGEGADEAAPRPTGCGLEALPAGLVPDGEVVAFTAVGAPHWPLVCDRVLHGPRRFT